MNITTKVLLTLIYIGLALAIVNLIAQIVYKINYSGYIFERLIYWGTLIAIIFYTLKKTLKQHRIGLFIYAPIFLFIQCSQMLYTGKIVTKKQITLNNTYSIKTETTLITIPTTSIYQTNGFFEKEISESYSNIKNNKHLFTSLNEIDSLKLLNVNDSSFNIRFYLNKEFIDQTIKRKKYFNTN